MFWVLKRNVSMRRFFLALKKYVGYTEKIMFGVIYIVHISKELSHYSKRF